MDGQLVLLKGEGIKQLCAGGQDGAAGRIFRQTALMKRTAQVLCAQGMPLRHILTPYVDTVQLEGSGSEPLFGTCLLCLCGEGGALAVRQAAELAWAQLGMAGRLLINSSVPAGAGQAVLPFFFEPEPQAGECLDEAGGQVFYFTYPSPALEARCLPWMDRRAAARAELAFGEICARILHGYGARLLCCAGGQGAYWAKNEKGMQQKLRRQIAGTFLNKMAPACGFSGAGLRIYAQASKAAPGGKS